MIELQDIRVGDWFTHLHGLGVVRTFTVELYCKCHNRDMDIVEVHRDELMPIPLSERILELCGFDGNGILQLNENDVISYYPMQKTVGVAGFGCNAYRPIPWKVEHLHQLQHIYRDLTGKELNPDMAALSREIEERMIKEELYG
jgi:hypothetical protein